MQTDYDKDYGLTDQFRAKVLQYAQDFGVQEAAMSFNVGVSTIYAWKKRVKENEQA